MSKGMKGTKADHVVVDEVATAHPSNFKPHSEHVAEPDDLKWKPSEIQKAELIAIDTAKPKIQTPGVVTNEDFTTLWNRCVQMDKAMLEMIEHWKAMKIELRTANELLEAKQERIGTLEARLAETGEDVGRCRELIAEHDDRINWLET